MKAIGVWIFARVAAGSGGLLGIMPTPLDQIIRVEIRGSPATFRACTPPQDWPITATFEVSSRWKKGLPERSFSRTAQSIDSVSCWAVVVPGARWGAFGSLGGGGGGVGSPGLRTR